MRFGLDVGAASVTRRLDRREDGSVSFCGADVSASSLIVCSPGVKLSSRTDGDLDGDGRGRLLRPRRMGLASGAPEQGHVEGKGHVRE